MATLSDAAGERVREARADRFPSLGVGVDWILTGPSTSATPPPDSGKDAVAVSLSVRVPLWAPAYRASEDEARARGAALRARALDARNGVAADVRQQLARTHEDVRRVRVYRSTLVPQAETTLESVLGSYAAGRSTVAELLLAERELLALHDELHAAEADYGTHLAQLESAVGRPVRTKGGHDADR
ncbi:MAG: TolC family protein [Myxococcales bacterium]|nr:TolC family protein [Myxococcales bacterium]